MPVMSSHFGKKLKNKKESERSSRPGGAECYTAQNKKAQREVVLRDSSGGTKQLKVLLFFFLQVTPRHLQSKQSGGSRSIMFGKRGGNICRGRAIKLNSQRDPLEKKRGGSGTATKAAESRKTANQL